MTFSLIVTSVSGKEYENTVPGVVFMAIFHMFL
jgi:hypothetical protein